MNTSITSWRPKSRFGKSLVLVLALQLVFPFSASQAQNSNAATPELAGKVVMVRGEVLAQDAAGAMRELARRADIYVGDTIITAADSVTQIRMEDDALVSLQESTRFAVVHYSYSESDPASSRSTLDLIEGGFRTISGKIGDVNKPGYVVNAGAFATIGIRGTDYEVVITPSGRLLTGVWQGGTTVSNGFGVLNLGFGASYDYGEVATPQSPPQGLNFQPQELGVIEITDLAGLPDNGNDDDDGNTDANAGIAAAPNGNGNAGDNGTDGTSIAASRFASSNASLTGQSSTNLDTSIAALNLTGANNTETTSTENLNPNETHGAGLLTCANSGASAVCRDSTFDNSNNGNSGNGNGNGNGNSGNDNGNSGNDNGNSGNGNGNGNSGNDNGNSGNGNGNNGNGNGNSGNDNGNSGNGNGNSGNGNGNGNSGNGNGNGSSGNDNGNGNSGNGNGNSGGGSGNDNGNGNSGNGNGNSGGGSGNDNGNGNSGGGSGNDNGNGNSGNGNGNSGNGNGNSGGGSGNDNGNGNSGNGNGNSGGGSGNDNGNGNSGGGNSGNSGNGNGNGNGNGSSANTLELALTQDNTDSAISWGIWNNPLAMNWVNVSTSDSGLTVSTSDYLATVNPAAIANLQGQHHYASGSDSAFVGQGNLGAVSELSAGFDVNFDTGRVANGNLLLRMADQTWSVNFNGYVAGGAATLDAVSGQISNSTGIISNSVGASLGGAFAGSNGESFIGGFDMVNNLDTLNQVNGLFTLER